MTELATDLSTYKKIWLQKSAANRRFATKLHKLEKNVSRKDGCEVGHKFHFCDRFFFNLVKDTTRNALLTNGKLDKIR